MGIALGTPAQIALQTALNSLAAQKRSVIEAGKSDGLPTPKLPGPWNPATHPGNAPLGTGSPVLAALSGNSGSWQPAGPGSVSKYVPSVPLSPALQAINTATYPVIPGRDVTPPSLPAPWGLPGGAPAPLRVASTNTSMASQLWPGAPKSGGLFGGIGDFLGGLGTQVADISGQVGGALNGVGAQVGNAGKAVADTVGKYGPLMAALKPYTGGTLEQRLSGQVGLASGNGDATASLVSSGPDVSGFPSFGSIDAWKAAGRPSDAIVTTNSRGLQKSGGALIGDGF